MDGYIFLEVVDLNNLSFFFFFFFKMESLT